jgi:signal transduction histidine kinase
MAEWSEIGRRLDFIGLDDEALAALRAAAPFLERHLPKALDAFYDKAWAFPETRRIFTDEAHLEQARQAQLRHWRLLAKGDFDAAYVEAARRIGLTHARIGLDPRWYITGYCLVIEFLVQRAVEQDGADDCPKAALDALIKASMFDMELVISVYLEAADHGRRAAEESAREALAELARASRVLSVAAFASSIAHEVNQPVAAIGVNSLTALHCLAKNPPDLDQARSALERIIRDADRTNAVVSRTRGMLTKSLSEHQLFDIHPLLREALLFTQSKQRQASIQVRTEFAAGLGLVWGDPVQIQQVAVNLIANAIDAMMDARPGARVLAISTEPVADGGVRVSVSDTGVGIDAADAERIFDHMFTTKSGGMGLGLSVCKAIVEAHGGWIGLTPNLPSGAVFTFSLPQSEAG